MMALSETLRVLLVSERLDQRLQAQAYLETADYAVDVAAPAAAAESGGTGRYQLLLLDPGDVPHSAVELVQSIRQASGRGLPVLCVLDELSPELESRLLGAGADDCVTWSLSRSELLWRVRSLLRHRRETSAVDPVSLLRVQCDELLQLSRRREETLSLLVHDMKNPLSGVISNGEYLGTSPGLDADQAACAQDILQASRRLHRMVLSLLDVVQSEDGRLSPQCRPIVVRELIDEVLTACSSRLRDKNVELEVRGATPGLSLSGDRDMLLRLLANLLDNAVIAAPTHTKVELALELVEGALELRFSDLGPSVPASERAAFLSELPPAKTAHGMRGKGRRGLGLRACRVITEAHGGRIWIEDRLPRGATIAVRLPV